MRQNVRIGKIDDFKWLAAFLVAAIHTSPLESVNATADFILTRVLARVAVPFFMMVTGFFVLYGAVEEGSFGRIGHSLKKLGLLYLAVTLLYLPVQVYRMGALSGSTWQGGFLRRNLLPFVVSAGGYDRASDLFSIAAHNGELCLCGGCGFVCDRFVWRQLSWLYRKDTDA